MHVSVISIISIIRIIHITIIAVLHMHRCHGKAAAGSVLVEVLSTHASPSLVQLHTLDQLYPRRETDRKQQHQLMTWRQLFVRMQLAHLLLPGGCICVYGICWVLLVHDVSVKPTQGTLSCTLPAVCTLYTHYIHMHIICKHTHNSGRACCSLDTANAAASSCPHGAPECAAPGGCSWQGRATFV